MFRRTFFKVSALAAGASVYRTSAPPAYCSSNESSTPKAGCHSSPSTTVRPMNEYIDHTVLKATCVKSDIVKLCDEAKEYKFAAVCVPPNFVAFAKSQLAHSNVQVATVIGFPFGYSNASAKIAEVAVAIRDGADELDVVANISAIKQGDYVTLTDEISRIMSVVRKFGDAHVKVKVIIESGVLTDEEIIECCRIYGAAGIDYLKTSTGYADKGASVHAVTLFRANLPPHVSIKASGGIRDYATALSMVQAGATRIGCSAGVSIMKGISDAGSGKSY